MAKTTTETKAKLPAKKGSTKAKLRREKYKKKQLLAESERGLIYVAHLPHGFYEAEIQQYFKQFGVVTNVRVCRSKKTGQCKGYAFVEFLHPDVAKIAAETMNNYLMFKKRIVAHYVEKRPPHMFHGKPSTSTSYRLKKRRAKVNTHKNREIDNETHIKKCKSVVERLGKHAEKLKALGIDFKLTPVDVPPELQ